PHPTVVRIAVPIGIQRRRADGTRQRAPPPVRARDVERPRLSMTSDPRQARTHFSEKTEPSQVVSKGTGVVVLLIVGVFLYAVRWALLPFVVSAVGAYICTPLIERLAKRTRLPRIAFVGAIFIALLAAATTVAILAVPSLVREATSTVGDLDET